MVIMVIIMILIIIKLHRNRHTLTESRRVSVRGHDSILNTSESMCFYVFSSVWNDALQLFRTTVTFATTDTHIRF